MIASAGQRAAPALVRTFFLLAAAFWAAAGCAADSAADLLPAPYRPPTVAGRIANPALSEASGMAASRRRAGCFWMVADSGNGPLIHAVGPAGEDFGSVLIEGAANDDWEDVASFERRGVPYLLIADTGDNLAVRKESVLYLVREPEVPGRPGISSRKARFDRRLVFRFPGGAKDCEAVAVDPQNEMVLMLTKRLRPPELYAIPLPPARTAEVGIARRLATVTALPVPSNAQLLADPIFGRFRSQPTAMDIAPNGRLAAVLTYGGAYLFERKQEESWTQAFSRPPAALPPFDLQQAESICFGSDGRTLFLSSEKRPAPLLRLEPMNDMRP